MFIICFRYYQMATKMTWKMQTPLNSSLHIHLSLFLNSGVRVPSVLGFSIRDPATQPKKTATNTTQQLPSKTSVFGVWETQDSKAQDCGQGHITEGTRYSKGLPGHQGLEFTSSHVQWRLICTSCLRSAPASFPLRPRTPFRGDGQRHRTPSARNTWGTSNACVSGQRCTK